MAAWRQKKFLFSNVEKISSEIFLNARREISHLKAAMQCSSYYKCNVMFILF